MKLYTDDVAFGRAVARHYIDEIDETDPLRHPRATNNIYPSKCNETDDYVSNPSQLYIRISSPDANHRLYPGKIYP
eukprot:4003396-Pleurochrysis_carterae.AAC.1